MPVEWTIALKGCPSRMVWPGAQGAVETLCDVPDRDLVRQRLIAADVDLLGRETVGDEQPLPGFEGLSTVGVTVDENHGMPLVSHASLLLQTVRRSGVLPGRSFPRLLSSLAG